MIAVSGPLSGTTRCLLHAVVLSNKHPGDHDRYADPRETGKAVRAAPFSTLRTDNQRINCGCGGWVATH
jgi:hypothetical protein